MWSVSTKATTTNSATTTTRIFPHHTQHRHSGDAIERLVGSEHELLFVLGGGKENGNMTKLTQKRKRLDIELTIRLKVVGASAMPEATS